MRMDRRTDRHEAKASKDLNYYVPNYDYIYTLRIWNNSSFFHGNNDYGNAS